MKKQFLIALMSAFFILPVAAKDIKISFHVNGKCGMCEERIENALDIKGIKFADWSKETKMCTVKFNPDIISEKEFTKLLLSSVTTQKCVKPPIKIITIYISAVIIKGIRFLVCGLLYLFFLYYMSLH